MLIHNLLVGTRITGLKVHLIAQNTDRTESLIHNLPLETHFFAEVVHPFENPYIT